MAIFNDKASLPLNLLSLGRRPGCFNFWPSSSTLFETLASYFSNVITFVLSFIFYVERRLFFSELWKIMYVSKRDYRAAWLIFQDNCWLAFLSRWRNFYEIFSSYIKQYVTYPCIVQVVVYFSYYSWHPRIESKLTLSSENTPDFSEFADSI